MCQFIVIDSFLTTFAFPCIVMKMIYAYLFLFTVLASLAQAAGDWEKCRYFPNIGFSMPFLRYAKADPIPPPETRAFVVATGRTLTREDLFNPDDLWFSLECCARWITDTGQSLIIARMEHQPLPAQEEDMTRSAFQAAMALSSSHISVSDTPQLRTWIERCISAPVKPGEHVKGTSFDLEEVLYFPCDLTNTLIYAFRPQNSETTSSKTWFCAIYQSSEVRDPADFRADFEANFLAQIKTKTARQGDAAIELNVNAKTPPTVDRPDDPIRREARKSIENYSDWWIYEVNGYVILSDVDPSTGKTLVDALRKNLPILQKAYVTLAPPFSDDHDISVLRIFRNPADYVRYVGEGYSWTEGVWMPKRRELVALYTDNTTRLLRVIQHEAFHQYISFAYCMQTPAPWFNEGHAMLVEQATISQKSIVTLPEDEERLALLMENFDVACENMEAFLLASYDQFYGGTDAERRLKYAMAYGIVYYLQKSKLQERNAPYAWMIDTYAETIKKSSDYQEANQRLFEKIDMADFVEKFSAFWRKRQGNVITLQTKE